MQYFVDIILLLAFIIHLLAYYLVPGINYPYPPYVLVLFYLISFFIVDFKEEGRVERVKYLLPFLLISFIVLNLILVTPILYGLSVFKGRGGAYLLSHLESSNIQYSHRHYGVHMPMSGLVWPLPTDIGVNIESVTASDQKYVFDNVSISYYCFDLREYERGVRYVTTPARYEVRGRNFILLLIDYATYTTEMEKTKEFKKWAESFALGLEKVKNQPSYTYQKDFFLTLLRDHRSIHVPCWGGPIINFIGLFIAKFPPFLATIWLPLLILIPSFLSIPFFYLWLFSLLLLLGYRYGIFRIIKEIVKGR